MSKYFPDHQEDLWDGVSSSNERLNTNSQNLPASSILKEILLELKIMNVHLQEITGERVKSVDCS